MAFGASSFGGSRTPFKSNFKKVDTGARPAKGGSYVGVVVDVKQKEFTSTNPKAPKAKFTIATRILGFGRVQNEGLTEDSIVGPSDGSFADGRMTLNVNGAVCEPYQVTLIQGQVVEIEYAVFQGKSPSLEVGNYICVTINPNMQTWGYSKTLDNGQQVNAGDPVMSRNAPKLSWRTTFPVRMDFEPDIGFFAKQMRTGICRQHVEMAEGLVHYEAWDRETQKTVTRVKKEYVHLSDDLGLVTDRDANGEIVFVSWTANVDWWGDAVEVTEKATYGKVPVDIARMVYEKEDGEWKKKLFILTCNGRQERSFYMNNDLWAKFGRTLWNYFKGTLTAVTPSRENTFRGSSVQKQYASGFVPARPNLPAELDNIVLAGENGMVDLGEGFDLVMAKVADLRVNPDMIGIMTQAGVRVSWDAFNEIKGKVKIFPMLPEQKKYGVPERAFVILNEVEAKQLYLVSPEIFDIFAMTPMTEVLIEDEDGEVVDSTFHHNDRFTTEDEVVAHVKGTKGKNEDVLFIAVRKSYMSQEEETPSLKRPREEEVQETGSGEEESEEEESEEEEQPARKRSKRN